MHTHARKDNLDKRGEASGAGLSSSLLDPTAPVDHRTLFAQACRFLNDR